MIAGETFRVGLKEVSNRNDVVNVPLTHVFPRHARLELAFDVDCEFSIRASDRRFVPVWSLVAIEQGAANLRPDPAPHFLNVSPPPFCFCLPKSRKLPFVSLHFALRLQDDKTGIVKTFFPAVFRGTFRPCFSGTKRTLPRKTS
jgi:hypothetical protein